MQEQIQYYDKRALEYDLIYQKEERQADLKKIKNYLSNQFVDKHILEIACGTGYWTQLLSRKTKSILATDINESVLEIAKARTYPNQNVEFRRKDFNTLDQDQLYEGLFGGFIWSHIHKEKLNDFLSRLMKQLKNGSPIIFIDNRFVSGSSTPINRTDSNENTYQLRKLKTGEEFEVIKNFPTHEELLQSVSSFGKVIDVIELEYYWILQFVRT